MEQVLLELSKYAILLLFLMFTLTGFRAIGKNKGRLFYVQRVFLLGVHFLAYVTFFIHTKEMKYLLFYGVQLIYFIAVMVLYDVFYPKMSKLIVNNMCMLLAIGFVMIARITFDRAVKQFVIVVGASALGLFVPFFIRKMRWLSKCVWLYAMAGIGLLAVMKLAGSITYGASISFRIAGITIQPIELVKIIFVFFLASFLAKRHDLKSILIVSAVSAVHVLLLVWSRELGGALIFCVVYLCLVYVATRQPLYFIGGLAGGSAAAVVAYHLFHHVKVRVLTWSTPFSVIKNDTSQISQSLFAIGIGGWFGMGLMEGMPQTIPVASEDFIFSAITEELGMCFSFCMILICLSTFIMFINIATKIREPFYKLVATGLGVGYIFQVFLTIGGGSKFIPLTGVTLPLVSYGGSSVLCSILIFQIIQGIYVLKAKEDKIPYEESEDSYEDEEGYYEPDEEYEEEEYDRPDDGYGDEEYDGGTDYYDEEEFDGYDEEYEEEDEEYDGYAGEYEEEDGEYDRYAREYEEEDREYDNAPEEIVFDDFLYQQVEERERLKRKRAYEEYQSQKQQKPPKSQYDEYAAADEMQLHIPEEFFDD